MIMGDIMKLQISNDCAEIVEILFNAMALPVIR